MPWTALQPIPKGGRAMCSATITDGKAGLKLVLFMADSVAQMIGDPDKAAVEFGEGEHSGMLRVTFPDDGVFPLKGFLRGGLRLSLPHFEALPSGPRANAPCHVVSHSKEELVIRLPLEGWQPPPGAAKPSSALPPPVKVGGKLDVVEYLRPRGEQIERLAGGRFQLNGETVTMSAVLMVVNAKRKQADLEALALGAVF